MPKVGLTDAQWTARANRLAQGEKLKGKGNFPKNEKWKEIFAKIKKCPVTLRLQNGGNIFRSSFTTPSSTINAACQCGWDHDPPEPPAVSSAPAAAPAAERQEKQIDFGILRKPNARTTVGEVRDICRVYKTEGCYDLKATKSKHFTLLRTGRCMQLFP